LPYPRCLMLKDVRVRKQISGYGRDAIPSYVRT